MHRAIGILITTLVLAESRSVDEPCGEYRGWKHYNGSCYYFPISISGTHSWFEARDHCNNLGGHLVSIHSPEENDFVTGAISNIFGGFYNELWLGLNAVGNDAAFEWSDGTLVNFMGLEGNTEGLLQREKKCVSLNRLAKPMRWQLEHCNNQLSYICKRPQGVTPSTITPPPTTLTPGNCPTGWRKIGNNCVKIFSEPKVNWTEARDACETMGPKGTLVTIHDPYEQMQLTSMLKDSPGNVWIGVNKQPFVAFRWADSSRFDFTNWAPGEPTSQYYFDTCGIMQVSKVLPGRWKTSKCKEQLGYMCQIRPSTDIPPTTPTPPNCPTTKSGYQRYGDSCFKVYGNETRSFDEAERTCQEDGGHLTSVNNGLEQNFLASLLMQDDGNTDSLWLGLRDSKEKVFKWTNQWPVYYTNWAIGHPTRSNQSRCAFIDTNSREWNTSSCSENHGFICKVTIESPPKIPEHPDRVCPAHVPNWTNLGTEYCYYIESGKSSYERKSWGEAVTYCLQNDATLVSFHTQHDVDILIPYIQLSGVSMWTGLIKKHNGAFSWQDGTPMDFETWDDGEPSIFNNPQCGALSITLKTEANDCSQRYGFVCKILTIAKNQN